MADAFISYVYIGLHEGTMHLKGPEFFSLANGIIQQAYESKDTQDQSISFINSIIYCKHI